MNEAYLGKVLPWRAKVCPDRVAIIDWHRDEEYTWGALKKRSDSLACYLTEALGLKKGDRIGFVVDTDISLFDAFYATCSTGLIITTYNTKFIASETLSLIENETPRVVLFSQAYETKIAAIKEGISYPCTFVCVDTNSSLCDVSYEEMISYQGNGELPSVSITENDPAMFIHTGGTTGKPKAAIISHKALFLSAVSTVTAWQITSDDIAYICMPFFHVGGWNCPALGMLLVGAKMIIAPAFSPQLMLEITAAAKPDFFLATEAMLKAISQHPQFEETDFSSYRWIMAGGSPITAATMQPYWNRGVKVLNGYGMTEIVAFVLTSDVNMSLEANMKKLDSVGKPLPFSDVRLVDDQNRDVEQGALGEIVVGGSAIFSGYWGETSETAVVIDDGWVHTGDLGFQDEDGDFYVRGRKKDMFISGGENIFPIEVENMLATHPAILECAVIGIPDDTWGEVGHAFIVIKQGSELTEEDIELHLADSLSTIKKPKSYSFIEEIPKTAVGKKDIKALMDLAAEIQR